MRRNKPNWKVLVRRRRSGLLDQLHEELKAARRQVIEGYQRLDYAPPEYVDAVVYEIQAAESRCSALREAIDEMG